MATTLATMPNIVKQEKECVLVASPSHTSNGLDTNANTTNDNPVSNEAQPDHDTIKMFVGQVPKAWDEAQLKELFGQYGPVHQLNVLRDKATNASRGCCFVTFYHRKDSIAAQSALHNVKTLPGMHHPVQIKPADSENRNDRKLFVGMICKKSSEDDVRQLFATYGPIEDCTVLRNADGLSKGCAFVTFASRQNAQTAIRSMNHSQTMEGCAMPIVVKFADTQKEKEQKKQHVNPLNGIALSTPATGKPPAAPVQTPANPYLNILSALGVGGGGTQQLLQLQQLAVLAAAAGLGNTPTANGNMAALGASEGDTNLCNQLSSLVPALLSLIASTNNSPQPIGGANLPSAQNNAAQQFQQYSAAAGYGARPQMAQTPQGQQAQLLQNLLSNYGGQQQCSMDDAYTNNVMSAYPSISSSYPAISSSNCPLNGSAASLAGFPLQAQSRIDQRNAYAQLSAAGLSQLNPLMSGGMKSQPMAVSSANSNLITLTGQQTMTNPALSPLAHNYAGIQQYAAALNPGGTFVNPGANGVSPAAGKQIEGPEGANLFIYHLPQEFTDTDLVSTFTPFGSVMSAKVFIDKQTNLSKCFGFVSYDNAVSAQAAIQAMHGFQVGTKRLKVQLKRSKNDGKPYSHPSHPM